MAKTLTSTALVTAFSTSAAARISGLSIDMVNYLYRHKIVRPSVEKKCGKGVARSYAYADVLLLRVLCKLLAQGISVLGLKKCMVALQKRGGDLSQIVSKRFVATDGYNVYFGSRDVLEMLGSGQMAFAFVIELGSLRSEVDSKIYESAKVA
jgi:DNA-binding transcriptional MerR regulator